MMQYIFADDANMSMLHKNFYDEITCMMQYMFTDDANMSMLHICTVTLCYCTGHYNVHFIVFFEALFLESSSI